MIKQCMLNYEKYIAIGLIKACKFYVVHCNVLRFKYLNLVSIVLKHFLERYWKIIISRIIDKIKLLLTLFIIEKKYCVYKSYEKIIFFFILLRKQNCLSKMLIKFRCYHFCKINIPILLCYENNIITVLF